jgi:hypothetical protein
MLSFIPSPLIPGTVSTGIIFHLYTLTFIHYLSVMLNAKKIFKYLTPILNIKPLAMEPMLDMFLLLSAVNGKYF